MTQRVRRPETLLATVRRLLALIAVLALSASSLPGGEPGGRAACSERVLADWFDNGRIDRVYALQCYEEAIDALPTDIRDYTDAEDVDRPRADERGPAASPAPPAAAGACRALAAAAPDTCGSPRRCRCRSSCSPALGARARSAAGALSSLARRGRAAARRRAAVEFTGRGALFFRNLQEISRAIRTVRLASYSPRSARMTLVADSGRGDADVQDRPGRKRWQRRSRQQAPR